MPTYDYECDACHHKWELFQKITANPIRKCPSCGKLKAVRQFGTGAAIVFKGSGFYETDYRSDAYKKSAKADSESSKGESKSKESKSDSSGTGDTSSGKGKSADKASDTKPKKPKKD